MRRSKDNAGGRPRALHNQLRIELVTLTQLRLDSTNARVFDRAAERTAERIVAAHEFIPPLVVAPDGTILVGEIIFRAARKLGIHALPTVFVSEELKPEQRAALSVAYQRLGELGTWDRQRLTLLHLDFEMKLPSYDPVQIGFEVGAMDLLIGSDAKEEPGAEPEIDPLHNDRAVTQLGDVWQLGRHRVICADSTDPATFVALMAGVSKAALVFSDPPFGCEIDGFVARAGRHREFVMGSGDMSPGQLANFFHGFIAAFIPHLKPGALVELVIDWRSLHLLLNAAEPLLGPLINLAVWAKDRAGQGAFLRSQHELILIFKAGKARYRNNVQLGRHGRNRSNVWSYPSAKTASTGSDEGDMLKHHPTPKPVRLVADAILDCTRRGDIVLDAFLGSGTTLIAAEKVGRTCHAVELDPRYVDLAVRRWQAWTDTDAVHQATGRTFSETEAASENGNG